MFIIGIMLVGVLVGYRWLPEKYQKMNSHFQLICTLLLIFSMGVLLGKRENFWNEITHMGMDSLLLAVLPMLGSALTVYFLTTLFFKWKRGGK